jgi:hypothetical protein
VIHLIRFLPKTISVILPIMFDEPSEDPSELSATPADRAKEKADEFRMHAELFAVFEATRKFDAQIIPGLNTDLARDVQQTMARLSKAMSPEVPLVPEPSMPEAERLLNFPTTHSLSANDYHIHRRPGEVMIIRWIAGEEVEKFYERLQAHLDAALGGFREDERQSLEWKKDPATLAYLEALDAVEIKMADRYARDPIRQHNLFVLSTQTADEMNIAYLCDYIMGASPAEVVGAKSAPPESPTDKDLAWFFKLFSLRGSSQGVEKMCFFTFLQKSDDSFDLDE